MVIHLTLEMIIIIFLTLSVIGYLIYKRKNIKVHYWLVPVIAIYIIELIDTTIFPIYTYDMRQELGKYFKPYSIVPFASIKEYLTTDTCIQLIGNLVLLSPIVVFIEIYTKGKWSAKKVILSASFVSVFIEVTQLIITYLTGFPARFADIDDIIINSLGVVITFFITRFVERLIKNNQKSHKVVRKMLYL